VTIARLVLEIRRRADTLSNEYSAAVALELAAREVLCSRAPKDEDGLPAYTTLTALLNLHDGQRFDAAMLQGLTPELILRLDAMIHAIGRHAQSVRALRAAVIHRAEE
jgi:hypothetical protein